MPCETNRRAFRWDPPRVKIPSRKSTLPTWNAGGTPAMHPPSGNGRPSATRCAPTRCGRRAGFTTRAGRDSYARYERPVGLGRRSPSFPRASRGTKTTLRGLKNECSRAETPRRKQPRAPRRTDVSPKKTNGTVNAPVHNSNRVRKRQMRRAVARRASLSNARRLAAFPAPLEKKRRKQTPGPTPVSRAAATSHARAHPFTALRDLNKTQEMPTG